MRASKPQGGFIILEESDPEKILEESIELNKRLSENLSGKTNTGSFLTKLGKSIKLTTMRYLRILKKADFEEYLETDRQFLELNRRLDSLNRDRSEARSKLRVAGTDVTEYKQLSKKLVKFDRELEEAYTKYSSIRDSRAAFIKDLNTEQKHVYQNAQEDIQYFSKKFKHVDKEIQDVEKAIQHYKAAKYKEVLSTRLENKPGPDSRGLK